MRICTDSETKLRGRTARLVGPQGPVDDLLQDVFVNVYPKRERLEPRHAVKYLMRAASNRALDYRRRHRPVDYSVENVCSLKTPQDELVRSELQSYYDREIRPLLETLPGTKREAVEGFLGEEKRSTRASRLGLPPSTLRSRELAAFNDLRSRLDYQTVAELVSSYSSGS